METDISSTFLMALGILILIGALILLRFLLAPSPCPRCAGNLQWTQVVGPDLRARRLRVCTQCGYTQQPSPLRWSGPRWSTADIKSLISFLFLGVPVGPPPTEPLQTPQHEEPPRKVLTEVVITLALIGIAVALIRAFIIQFESWLCVSSSSPSDLVAVSPLGDRVYTASIWDNVISVIDTRKSKETAVVHAGFFIDFALKVDSSGRYLYALHTFIGEPQTGFEPAKRVAVIDTATNGIIDIVEVQLTDNHRPIDHSGPFSASISSEAQDGPVTITEAATNKSIVVSRGSTSDALSDFEKGTVQGGLRTGKGPSGMALSPSGTYLYVAHTCEPTVAVLDLRTKRVVSRIRVVRKAHPFALP